MPSTQPVLVGDGVGGGVLPDGAVGVSLGAGLLGVVPEVEPVALLLG